VPTRCGWVPEGDPLYLAYHDEEWGVPSHDDRHLFEMLILEGAQAGLSWSTILRKRSGYRKAFAGFDADRVASFSDQDVARLLTDASIVRNRAKVEAAVGNARATLAVRVESGSLDAYLWRFTGGRPNRNRWRRLEEIPTETEEARAMSKDLKRRGFRFVGPTTCYAFMQATGMVNDHLMSCFRWSDIDGGATGSRGRSRPRPPGPRR
jgi:DNA-3-methyladenine glycosylase I